MGFLDLFIEREDKKKSSSPETATSSNNSAPSRIVFRKDPPQTTSTVNKDVIIVDDEEMRKFNEHFDEIFEKANLPGPDYFEFSKMCTAMSSLPDNTKIPAVFTGLQVQGLTKEKLLSSAEHYIAIINEDEKHFDVAIDQKIISEVQRMRQESENLKASILQKEEMIKQLQTEIGNQEVEVMRLEETAHDKEQKATQKAQTYRKACEIRKSLIKTDIEKIKNYVK